MIKKKVRPSAILDRMHKGVVCACLGLTAYGCYLLGWRFYRYVTHIRPMREQQRLLASEQLLAEGSPDKLVDAAPEIKG